MLRSLLADALRRAAPPAPAAAPAAGAAAGRRGAGRAAAAEAGAAAGRLHATTREGRRDPFVSLVGRGDGSEADGTRRRRRPPGCSSNEITVKGVVRGTSGYLAMIQAPDNKTYIVRSGDRLARRVGQDHHPGRRGVLAGRHDPLSLVKQREVPKRVRATDGRG